MNGKRAKQLRRAARQSTTGLPERAYIMDERAKKEYLTHEHGMQKFSRTIALGPSCRHFYHLLRQQYRQWQVSGEIKARHVREMDKARNNRLLFTEIC
jgi:hypothetical protein